eukprot:734583-Pelagomonas_calceolata.AAC.2
MGCACGHDLQTIWNGRCRNILGVQIHGMERTEIVMICKSDGMHKISDGQQQLRWPTCDGNVEVVMICYRNGKGRSGVSKHWAAGALQGLNTVNRWDLQYGFIKEARSLQIICKDQGPQG